jgi:hypothetical protein
VATLIRFNAINMAQSTAEANRNLALAFWTRSGSHTNRTKRVDRRLILSFYVELRPICNAQKVAKKGQQTQIVNVERGIRHADGTRLTAPNHGKGNLLLEAQSGIFFNWIHKCRFARRGRVLDVMRARLWFFVRGAQRPRLLEFLANQAVQITLNPLAEFPTSRVAISPCST